MRRFLQLMAVLSALALAAFLTLAWNPAPPLPADLTPRAGTYDVRILRDTWGVPHIFGRRDADVAYGLAWAHAEDDFATIQGALLAARGHLATLLGRQGAPNDYMVALLRVEEQVAAGYPGLSADVRALCEAYAAGVNHYAALHPKEAMTRLYPVTGADVVRGFVHKLPLFFGIDQALGELFEGEPPALGDLGGGSPMGSNAFAVGPARSAEGKTLLAINSHQPWEGPVAWYEAHLKSEEGWNMVGGIFPGAPLVLHGHNQSLGWAHTVNKPDLVDVYALEIDPENPRRYRMDGQWRELDERVAEIEVKLFGPFSWTFKRPVWESVQGPAVRLPDASTYALRYAGMGEVAQVEQWFRMNKAQDFETWRGAMEALAIPMFNTVYADASGRVFYVYNGRLSRRAPGFNWRGYLPGNTSATLWQESLTFEELPQVLDPASGFVQSCNNAPWNTTLGGDNPQAEDYPPELGIENRLTNRALRALALLGGDGEITVDEFAAYKYDTSYSPRSWMAELRDRTVALPPGEAPFFEEGRRVLAAWDLETDAKNLRTALAVMAFGPWFQDELEAISDLDLETSVSQAASLLMEHHGSLEVPWGEVNRLVRGEVDLGLAGAPDVLHAVYGELAEDGRLRGVAGDAYILMVEWDAEGEVHSRSVHQYGSATLDETSPHYADQAALFARRELRPVWFEEADLRAHLEREYRPGEVATGQPED